MKFLSRYTSLGLLLFSTSAYAAITGQETTEQTVNIINVNDCSWVEVVERDTTTHYQEYVPFVTPTQQQPYAFSNLEGGGETGEGYTYEFVKDCYEYEPQGIETYHTTCPGYDTGNYPGEGITTTGFLPGESGGYWKEWDDTEKTTYLRHVSYCQETGTCHGHPWSPPENPEGPWAPTPELDSFVYLLTGLVFVGIAQWMRR